jgi:hypothetical protein
MGLILDFLTPGWVERRIGLLRAPPNPRLPKRKPESDAQLRRTFVDWCDGPGPPIIRGSDTGGRIELASLEHARGTDPASVRAILREAAAEWEPIIAAMHFRPRIYEGETPSSRTARNFKTRFGAVIKPRWSRDYHASVFHYRYKARPQPLQLDVLERVLPSAAIAGDFKLARRLARGYKANPFDDESNRHMILRHLLAEDDKSAAALAKGLEGGSMAGFPPEPIEFPLGVIRNDPKLLLKGVRRVATAAPAMFREDRYRGELRRIAARKSRLRPTPTWAQTLDSARSMLVFRGWLLPVYAVAYLNVARRRGIPLPFDDARLFDEFVPAELCVQQTASEARRP